MIESSKVLKDSENSCVENFSLPSASFYQFALLQLESN